jgi:hypothetical protein
MGNNSCKSYLIGGTASHIILGRNPAAEEKNAISQDEHL